MSRLLTLLFVFFIGLTGLRAASNESASRPGPFLIGADISWLPQDEAAGAEYYINGVKQDLFTILKGAGFNAIRLRIFVHPEDPAGYSRKHPDDPWCGLEQTKLMAKRVKAAGMAVIIDFHYSDNWADPEHQVKPAAWAALAFPELVKAMHDHTQSVLAALEAQGTPPAMVQIGNEITFGLLWPEGEVALTVPTGNPTTDANHMKTDHIGGYDQLAALLKAGIAATHEVDPSIKIMLHNHLGRKWDIVREWMDALLARDVQFDAVGFSCYQQQKEGDWENTFTQFLKRYPHHGVIAAEYSSRKRYVNDLVFNLPAQRGWGTFIWEPTRHQEAIFEHNGKNAGGGPRANLLAQGVNQAEAPGAASSALKSVAATPSLVVPAPAGPRSTGGRYDANAFLALYRTFAADYRAK